ncbi:MAG: HEAT repeat domain-containing protein, partial [Abditibacteriales bacterium]|nr:HEAT repeat domain-containing protein [Abditibacteriales bacterium]MDW8366674.1 HEAT repeat domain-containing protein [Abditibacteriales bacterium]
RDCKKVRRPHHFPGGIGQVGQMFLASLHCYLIRLIRRREVILVKKARIIWLVIALAAVAVGADRLGFGPYYPRFPTPGGGSGAPHPPLTREQSNFMADIRAIGLYRDRSQMTKVRAALKEEHPFIVITALQALGRLGASEAVEDIRALQRRLPEGSEIQPFISLALARIQAEGSVPQAFDRARLQQKLQHFWDAAAVSVSQIHKGAAGYAVQRRAGQDQGFAPFEVQVLRQTAEIVCKAYERGVGDAFAVRGVDFAWDHAAQLKAQLGQMSREQRIQWLVDSLSKKQVGRWEEDYEMQALADEGRAATQVITGRLQQMSAHRDQYPHHVGFALLFRTLAAIGDSNAIPIVNSFSSDDDRWVRYYSNQSLKDLKQGWRKVWAIDY